MFVLINTQQKPNKMLLLPKCVAMRCFFVAMSSLMISLSLSPHNVNCLMCCSSHSPPLSPFLCLQSLARQRDPKKKSQTAPMLIAQIIFMISF